MFRELSELGQRLEQQGKLPPPGFYKYTEPIKWAVHIWPDQPGKFDIRNTEVANMPRPFSGRTSGIQAHLLSDEAAYALGIDRKKGDDGIKKYRTFRLLLERAVQKLESTDPATACAIRAILTVLDDFDSLINNIRWKEIKSKDWVSFCVEDFMLPSGGQDLLVLPAVRKLWVEELENQCRQRDAKGNSVVGICGLTGEERPLAGRIPLKVKLWKPIPLHSLNKDAFVSGIEGTQVFKEASIGQSFEAGDRVARILNYLGANPLHCKLLATHRKNGKLEMDSPKNLFAFFWVKEDEPIQVGEVEIDPGELLKNAALILGEQADKNDEEPRQDASSPVDLSQLEAMLSVPWTARQSSLRLADNAFCLLMLSPNTGRISVREWFQVNLQALQRNLKKFLDTQRIVAPDGLTKKCFPISVMLRALEHTNISKPPHKAEDLANPNIARSLLRCAYLGEPPPAGVLEVAVLCFRHPKLLQRYEDTRERERYAALQHQLAAVLKMGLTYSDEENMMMESAHDKSESRGYLCGQLLAILEEAQLRSANWRINTTLVDRFYGTASSAPCSVMGMLVSRATTDHFSNIRKNQKGYTDLEALMERIQCAIHDTGGFPKILKLTEQAEFSLGFYCQRSGFSAQRPTSKSSETTDQKEEKE